MSMSIGFISAEGRMCNNFTPGTTSDVWIDEFDQLPKHPNLGDGHAFKNQDGNKFLVFERSTAGADDLETFRQKVDDFRDVRSAVEQITRGLLHIHKKEYLHLGLRDPRTYIFTSLPAGGYHVKISIEKCRKCGKVLRKDGQNRLTNMRDAAQFLTHLFCGVGTTRSDFESGKVSMNFPKIPKFHEKLVSLRQRSASIQQIYSPEAIDLVNVFLDVHSDIFQVLNHPFYWGSERRLNFIRDLHERISVRIQEKGGTYTYPNHLLFKKILSICEMGGSSFNFLEEVVKTDFNFVPAHIRQQLEKLREQEEEWPVQHGPVQHGKKKFTNAIARGTPPAVAPAARKKDVLDFVAGVRHQTTHSAGDGYKAMSLYKALDRKGNLTNGLEFYFGSVFPNLIIDAYYLAIEEIPKADENFSQYLDYYCY